MIRTIWVGWGVLLGALVGLLVVTVANETTQPPTLQPEHIQVLTCTTRVATVDSSGETHIETIDCKEDKQ